METGNNVFRIWNKTTTNIPLIHLGCGSLSDDLVVASELITMSQPVLCANASSVAEVTTKTFEYFEHL